jgi:hypothetical protein
VSKSLLIFFRYWIVEKSRHIIEGGYNIPSASFFFRRSEGGFVAENAYQRKLIRKLKRMFPGCEILKNDSQYLQGVLDLTILWGPLWAMLEVKTSRDAPFRPNQEYYIKRFDEMAFASSICPEDEEEVLTALQQAFASRGAACVPQS